MIKPANIMFTGFYWRSRRDSNPGAREGKRFSRPPRYDHFDTAPCILNCKVHVAKKQVWRHIGDTLGTFGKNLNPQSPYLLGSTSTKS